MQIITKEIQNSGEFSGHQEVIKIENTSLGVTGFVGIHSKRGSFPSLGATRVWAYNSEQEAMEDALRLSRLMSHKSVFAGLPYGGAKATLMVPRNSNFPRKDLFSWYAEELNSLGGIFITGSDVGVDESDVAFLKSKTNHVIGDDVPAAFYTAFGVRQGVETVLERLYGTPSPLGRTFAIQGLGKTGYELIKSLAADAKHIYVSDIDDSVVKEVVSKFPNTEAVDTSQIATQDVDVFSPCALSYSINSKSLPLLRCKAVVGSSNNQMESWEIERGLHQKGILYGIDYIVNNGGFISVVDQYENGTHDDDRIKQKIRKSRDILSSIFDNSKNSESSPGVIADKHVYATLNN